MDYLSFLTLQRRRNPDILMINKPDYVALNSVANVSASCIFEYLKIFSGTENQLAENASEVGIFSNPIRCYSEKSRTFAENCQDIKITGRMAFTGRIRQLREQRQLPQREVAEALDIDSATCCKIERGERRARKEHLSILADFLQSNKEELLILWRADQVVAVVEDESELAGKVLKVVLKKIDE